MDLIKESVDVNDDDIDITQKNSDTSDIEDKYDMRKGELVDSAKFFLKNFNELKDSEKFEGKSDDDIVEYMRLTMRNNIGTTDNYKTVSMDGILNQDEPLAFAQKVVDKDEFADSIAQTNMMKKTVDKKFGAVKDKKLNATFDRVKKIIPEIFNKNYKSLTFKELANILRKTQKLSNEDRESTFIGNIINMVKRLMGNKLSDKSIKRTKISMDNEKAIKMLGEKYALSYTFMKGMGLSNGKTFVYTDKRTGEPALIVDQVPGMQKKQSMDIKKRPQMRMAKKKQLKESNEETIEAVIDGYRPMVEVVSDGVFKVTDMNSKYDFKVECSLEDLEGNIAIRLKPNSDFSFSTAYKDGLHVALSESDEMKKYMLNLLLDDYAENIEGFEEYMDENFLDEYNAIEQLKEINGI